MSEQPPQDPYGQNPGGPPPEGTPGGQPPYDPNQPPAQPPYGQQPPPPPYGQQPPQQPPYGQQPPQDPNQPPGGSPGYGQNQGWGQDPNQPPGGGQGYGQPPPNYPAYGAGPGGAGDYSATDAIGYGFNKFKDNAGAFVLLALAAVGASIVISIIGSIVTDGSGVISYDTSGFSFDPLAGLFQIISQVVLTLFGAALIRGAFDAVDGREVAMGTMFERWDKLQVLVVALIVSVLSTIGFVLCVLPGFVVLFLTWFALYFVVEHGQDAVTAIKSSFSFTTNHFGPLLLLALLSFLCFVAGALACLVGLLVAYPVVTIASAYSFKPTPGPAGRSLTPAPRTTARHPARDAGPSALVEVPYCATP